MTTADQLRAQGRVAMLREMLTEQLTIKFGDLPAKIADAVNAADQEQLRRWTTRFATATSLNDMRIA